MEVKIENSWKQRLNGEFEKGYFIELAEFVKSEYANHKIYPPGRLIFSALDRCSFDSVRVVIIGQDPYHGPGQANGLSFSVNQGVKIPPSLRNIFRGLQADLGIEIPTEGDLTHWAEQGVFLLNATLTVRAHEAGSHQNKGWETFTDAVIEKLSSRKGLVYMLWGSFAQKKAQKIDASANLILKSPHPSPLSAYRGFFENNHFSIANDYLGKNGEKPISW